MCTNNSECQCLICRNKLPFDVDSDLLDHFLSGRVTLFAGAGISTEAPDVMGGTLYQDLASECDWTDHDEPLPVLAEHYSSLPNGRIRMLSRIQSRFQKIKAFPEMNYLACRFHLELATFYPVRTIITTNWDTYFEDICQATSFVTDKDLAFWDAADRRVLKIHGCINSLGSVIITCADYKKCEKRLKSGLIGSILKTILATQTVIFIGYSLSDSDFNGIYAFVRRQMRGFKHQAYLVTPDASVTNRCRELGLKPIITDGAFFIEQLKRHAIESGLMLADDVFDRASVLLADLHATHTEFTKVVDVHRYPSAIYAMSYQDGMIHGLQRALSCMGSGEYSNPSNILGWIDTYSSFSRERRKLRRYFDVAYIDGYIESLLFLLRSKEALAAHDTPFFYAFGIDRDLVTLNDYQSVLDSLSTLHKTSHAQAVKQTRLLGEKEGLVLHHPCWL